MQRHGCFRGGCSTGTSRRPASWAPMQPGDCRDWPRGSGSRSCAALEICVYAKEEGIVMTEKQTYPRHWCGGLLGFQGGRAPGLEPNRLPRHWPGCGTAGRREIRELDFMQADIRNPAARGSAQGGRRRHRLPPGLSGHDPAQRKIHVDINVMGTMRVLGRLRRGWRPKGRAQKQHGHLWRSPQQFGLFDRRQRTLRGSRRYGYTRDMIEIEAFCNGFQHQAAGADADHPPLSQASSDPRWIRP